MAYPNWIGGAPAIAQVSTITVGATVPSAGTYTITIGQSAIEYTAGGADTPTIVAAALVALATAATAPAEFQEAAWAKVAGVITMTQAPAYAGEPITVTSAATGTGATLVTAAVTASSGPNWWSVAQNWSTGAVPVTGDSVTITGGGANILYGLAQSAVTLAARTINSKTVQIGLPPINANGYPEYRPQYLAIGVTDDNLVQTSGRVKLNAGTVTTSITTLASATSADQASGVPAILLLADSSDSLLYVQGGSVGIAFFGGETAEFGALNMTGGTVLAGAGAELVSIDNAGGNLTFSANNATTTLRLDVAAGSVTAVAGVASGLGTADVYGGTFYYDDGGTIAHLNVALKGTANFTGNLLARTVTNATYSSGATIVDSSATVTHTNPFVLDGCRLADVSLDYGVGRSVQVS